jgi:acetyl-CoA carboxylase carboxyl transferase subunit alpha
LWRDATRAREAATAMKITAQDLKALGVIDDIIPEPLGGAHRDPEAAIDATGDVIKAALADLGKLSPEAVRKARREKFLAIGRNL